MFSGLFTILSADANNDDRDRIFAFNDEYCFSNSLRSPEYLNLTHEVLQSCYVISSSIILEHDLTIISPTLFAESGKQISDIIERYRVYLAQPYYIELMILLGMLDWKYKWNGKEYIRLIKENVHGKD